MSCPARGSFVSSALISRHVRVALAASMQRSRRIFATVCRGPVRVRLRRVVGDFSAVGAVPGDAPFLSAVMCRVRHDRRGVGGTSRGITQRHVTVAGHTAGHVGSQCPTYSLGHGVL